MLIINSSRAVNTGGESAPEETVDATDWTTEGDLEAEEIEPWRDATRFGGIPESFVISKKLYQKKNGLDVQIDYLKTTNLQNMKNWLLINNFIFNFFILSTENVLKTTLQFPGMVFRI